MWTKQKYMAIVILLYIENVLIKRWIKSTNLRICCNIGESFKSDQCPFEGWAVPLSPGPNPTSHLPGSKGHLSTHRLLFHTICSNWRLGGGLLELCLRVWHCHCYRGGWLCRDRDTCDARDAHRCRGRRTGSLLVVLQSCLCELWVWGRHLVLHHVLQWHKRKLSSSGSARGGNKARLYHNSRSKTPASKHHFL